MILGRAMLCAIGVVLLATTGKAQDEQAPPRERRVERLQVERFGNLFLDARNNLSATDLLAHWREYTIEARHLQANLDQERYRFFGGVSLKGGGVEAKGDALELDLRHRIWNLMIGTADLEPSFLRNQLLDAVRLSGQSLEGESRRVVLQGGQCTTCLLEHPHYHFSADQVEVVVDKRLVARSVSLYALGRRLFTLPSLVVPLDRRLSRGTLPQVGRSEEEGYYVKAAIGYLWQDNAGTARIDLMERKGIGLGFDQQYALAGATGLLSLYLLNDRSRASRSVNAQWSHQQRLLGFDARLSGDLRSGSYLYYSDTRSASWQASLSRVWASGNLSILSRLNQQSSAGYTSDSLTSSVRWNQRWGRQLSLALSADLSRFHSRFSGGQQSQQEQLLTQLALNGSTRRFDWTLSFNRNIPLGGQATGFVFGGLEKTPELVLSTTDQRLFGSKLGVQMQMGLASFRELPQPQAIQRLLFEARWNPTPPAGERVWLNYSALFRQVFTSDGTAQYVLQGNLDWQQRIAPDRRWFINYRYLRPYGYTPLRTEYTGYTNFASAGVEWGFGKALALRGYTGYDLFARQRGSRPWQPLNLGLQWQPSKEWQLNVQATLNLNEGQWNYLRAYLRGQLENLRLNLNAVYDPIRQLWANANLWIDARLFKTPFRVQSVVAYNGYVNRFESRQFLLTWDLHCWEMSVGYVDNPLGFRPDREVVFRLRIKAFPEVQRFGVGQFGQQLEAPGGIGW